MARKDFMLESLTALLEVGEELLFPVCGTVYEGSVPSVGFFGFTDKYMLVVLTQGKQITRSERVPLDIKSISFKKNLVGNYTVDIMFNEGDPIKIFLAHRDVWVDLQKENLPRFLERLRECAPKEHVSELESASGARVRRQYFANFIFLMVSFLPVPFIMIPIMSLTHAGVDLDKLVENWPIILAVIVGVFLPFILVSLISRFWLGGVICVINRDGICLDGGFIHWSSIRRVTYHPVIPLSRWDRHYAELSVVGEDGHEFAIQITHFPSYAIWKLKRNAPGLDVRLDRRSLVEIIFWALLPSVITPIITLFL